MTRIKLCGLSRPEDIKTANELMPEYIGFVFAPASRRYVPPSRALRLKEMLNPGIRAVGVFTDEAPEMVARLLDMGIIDLAQLHGHEDEAYISRLRLLTDSDIIQAIKVRTKQDLQRAFESSADHILLLLAGVLRSAECIVRLRLRLSGNGLCIRIRARCREHRLIAVVADRNDLLTDETQCRAERIDDNAVDHFIALDEVIEVIEAHHCDLKTLAGLTVLFQLHLIGESRHELFALRVCHDLERNARLDLFTLLRRLGRLLDLCGQQVSCLDGCLQKGSFMFFEYVFVLTVCKVKLEGCHCIHKNGIGNRLHRFWH